MSRRLARERWRLASLDEARSMLWVLRQLTSKKAASDIAASSNLYELHQIATKGMEAVEGVMGDIELTLKYEKQRRRRSVADPALSPSAR